MYKNHLWGGFLLLNHQTYSEKKNNIYTNRYTNIFTYLQKKKKKKPVTIFKLHGDQKEKKSELRTESANSHLEIIIRQIINI